MNCPICTTSENWHSLKELHREKELRVCKTCGFVGFKIEDDEEKKMQDYYRFQYRPAPGHGNLITTTHKQHYIQAFLEEYLKDKKELVIGDVGCATGYLVAFFRRLGHKATGCEYTLTYRRFAEHFYGVPITEELKDDIKYDFISVYHVLEHMIEPDKKLKKYWSLLKDGGHMLVSTPKWYDTLEEASGPAITSFENLWHKNHINVFSIKALKNLFKKTGLEIVKEDQFTYGQTYLLKKVEPIKLTQGDYEKPQEIIDLTHKAKKAIDLFVTGKFKEAVELWPKMPDAWVSLIMNTFGKDQERQKDAWEEAFKLMPNNKKLKTVYACIYLFQRAEYQKALEVINELIKSGIDEEKLFVTGQCYAMLGDHKKAMECFYKSAEINPTKWQVAMDFLGKEASSMPTWDEVALEKVAVEAAKQAKPNVILKDPMFEPNGHERKVEAVK